MTTSAAPDGDFTPSPWVSNPDGSMTYVPNFDYLVANLDGPLKETKVFSSGNWADALDDWISSELRRAGFPADEIWPRSESPRVLPREVGLLLEKASPAMKADLLKLIAKTPGVVSADARILGRAYVKQVDVVMAQWSRGPELMISTKTMMSSFRKNLPNRFEEAYGDAANLRGRYPLASIGFLFAMRASVLKEPGALQKAIDMLRKLKGADTYDATGLLLLDYSDDAEDLDAVAVLEEEVPPELRAGQFFEGLISRVLEVAPVEMHVLVRENREHRQLAVEETNDS